MSTTEQNPKANNNNNVIGKEDADDAPPAANIRDDLTERDHFSWKRVPFAICLAISLAISITAFVVGNRKEVVVDECVCGSGFPSNNTTTPCQEGFCYCTVPANNALSQETEIICLPQDEAKITRFEAPARPVAIAFLILSILAFIAVCTIQMLEIDRQRRNLRTHAAAAAASAPPVDEENNA